MPTTLQKAAQGHIKLISFCCFFLISNIKHVSAKPSESAFSTPHAISWAVNDQPLLKTTEAGEGIIKPEVSVCDLQEI